MLDGPTCAQAGYHWRYNGPPIKRRSTHSTTRPTTCPTTRPTTRTTTRRTTRRQPDHSKIPLEYQKYMNCVREMLNNETQLFLKWGVGGTFRDNRTICWTSNKSTPLALGYQRHERFYNTVVTQDCSQDRDTTYYVGPSNYTPKVVVQARINASAEATDSPQPLTDNSTCLLWAQRHGNRTIKKLCEDAFNSNCSDIQGTVYKRGHGACNLTDDMESEEDE
ncbi:uncharacterized protein LOC142590132 isoform X2 [Dermacentor variabilis]|uniref:uncharacterized protein LOC142590132 isoform X2 n=1 Tax=Dermacentor variabilis TaxID=34621 RepID=UPI003F5B76B6